MAGVDAGTTTFASGGGSSIPKASAAEEVVSFWQPLPSLQNSHDMGSEVIRMRVELHFYVLVDRNI